MPELKPLYPYAGGKVGLIKHFSKHLTRSDCYVEPFFGGGSVFCYMVNCGLAKRFIINDINAELIKIYLDIQDDGEAVIDELNSIWDAYAQLSTLDKKHKFNAELNLYHRSHSSGRLLFLMNTSFGAMWTTDPATGRYAPTSGHNGVQANKDHKIVVYQIRLWRAVLKGAHVQSMNYSDIEVPDNSLVYCDPPYRNALNVYSKMFSDDEQGRLFDWCCHISKRNTVRVIQTNNGDGDFFSALIEAAGNVVCEQYNANYSNGPIKNLGKEVVMVWNP
ncbi:DNA adenine methylase [Azospirillaceae bacterium]